VSKKIIDTTQAPAAIGTYSQAVRVGDTVYISGQIPLHPETQQMIEASFRQQLFQVFDNLQAVCTAAGGSLNDIVKLTVYLTDLNEFPIVNTVMAEYFSEPYPARAVLGVASLPKGAPVEMDAIMVLNQMLV
jgi:reactive intermediate/imine deaminase